MRDDVALRDMVYVVSSHAGCNTSHYVTPRHRIFVSRCDVFMFLAVLVPVLVIVPYLVSCFFLLDVVWCGAVRLEWCGVVWRGVAW